MREILTFEQFMGLEFSFELAAIKRLEISRQDIGNKSAEEQTLFWKQMARCKNLTHLHLYWNKLTTLPAEIGNLGTLEVLAVNSNNLTTLPAEIGNLVALRKLILLRTNLTTIAKLLLKRISRADIYIYCCFLPNPKDEITEEMLQAHFDVIQQQIFQNKEEAFKAPARQVAIVRAMAKAQEQRTNQRCLIGKQLSPFLINEISENYINPCSVYLKKEKETILAGCISANERHLVNQFFSSKEVVNFAAHFSINGHQEQYQKAMSAGSKKAFALHVQQTPTLSELGTESNSNEVQEEIITNGVNNKTISIT